MSSQNRSSDTIPEAEEDRGELSYHDTKIAPKPYPDPKYEEIMSIAQT